MGVIVDFIVGWSAEAGYFVAEEVLNHTGVIESEIDVSWAILCLSVTGPK